MTKETPARQPAKKAYAEPKLIRHGDVKTLTRSGASGVPEPTNSGQGSPQKKG